MGERPTGMTLDRRKVDEDYSPENCFWADLVSQARNRRTNRVIEIDGVSLCLKAWSEIYGVNYSTICTRINRGMDALAALGISI
jgi:hypothetical protein